ncbi:MULTISPECIES: MoaD/ThiS family protein [Helicobacter]|uniref:MoaD/ThiS family protein n=1 Tax=Helicobacter TaxID=209 RepID=UPI002029BBBB|nr:MULTISPECIES: MoaD/ThiS family protein [Helicobacter]MCI7047026.1 MoaD/ThiS family protein [Helicobacter sp.]MCL9820237.1 MoaD/ThiS family protein [Helicobacter colisuis]MCL9822261.1 MoaD/ThiS family protein [Helicobacter colisuis]
MIEVELLGPLGNQKFTSNAKDFYTLKKELQQDSAIQNWLKDCAIALNDEIVQSLDTPLKDGDKVVILPPVCGG